LTTGYPHSDHSGPQNTPARFLATIYINIFEAAIRPAGTGRTPDQQPTYPEARYG